MGEEWLSSQPVPSWVTLTVSTLQPRARVLLGVCGAGGAPRASPMLGKGSVTESHPWPIHLSIFSEG